MHFLKPKSYQESNPEITFLQKLGVNAVEIFRPRAIGRRHNRLDEHFEIYEALKARNPARAKAAAENHIRSFLKSISSDV
jgi:DNA-binding GntR family transcriptional regulator